MESKKWLALILLIIAILGSLEYMPRNVLLQVAIPSTAPYPLNKGPTGTSRLWSYLQEQGFQTSIIYGYSGLPKLSKYRDLVYLDIGGIPGSSPKEAYSILKRAYDEGLRVHFILLDEKPDPMVWDLVVNASNLICGLQPLDIKGILNSTINTMIIVAGNKKYRVPTGYTGYIDYLGSPLATPGEPSLPMQLGGFRAISAAWPYPTTPYQGEWYITGVECSSNKGSVVLIADSTIAINMEAQSVPESMKMISKLISERVEKPSTTLIIVDEELYVNPGKGNLQLILSLHPSVLLLAFSRVYSSIEPIIVNGLLNRMLGPLLLAAIASILAGSTFYASRLLAKEEVKRGRKEKPHVTFPISIGSWRRLTGVCYKSNQLSTLTVASEETSEIVKRLIEKANSRCRKARRSRILRYIPLWGKPLKEVKESMALALSISGVYTYEEALSMLEGEK